MVLRRPDVTVKERDCSGEVGNSSKVQGVALRGGWGGVGMEAEGDFDHTHLVLMFAAVQEALSHQCCCIWCCAINSQVGPTKALHWNVPELAKLCKKVNGLERKCGGLFQGLLFKVSYAQVALQASEIPSSQGSSSVQPRVNQCFRRSLYVGLV